MKKLILALALASVLGGCVTTQQAQFIDRYKVVMAPDSLYNCPVVTQWPAVKTLTDLQVARLLVQLAENNKICKSSLDAIRRYYREAAARLEGQAVKR